MTLPRWSTFQERIPRTGSRDLHRYQAARPCTMNTLWSLQLRIHLVSTHLDTHPELLRRPRISQQDNRRMLAVLG